MQLKFVEFTLRHQTLLVEILLLDAHQYTLHRLGIVNPLNQLGAIRHGYVGKGLIFQSLSNHQGIQEMD